MRKQEQYEVVVDAVETAIVQAAEISGFRNWFVWSRLKNLKKGESPNEESIVQSLGSYLEHVFEDMINPDDKEYFESELYRNRNTGEKFGGVGNPVDQRRHDYFRQIGREEAQRDAD